jgi:PKD repeat protein
VSLAGSYSDPTGTVSPSGIAWDTNYNGTTFNPVMTGTLTPSVTFSNSGNYRVALRITDSTGASDISELNVIADFNYQGPTATAGPDQTASEGASVSFNGSYTDPDGTVSASNIAWDFDYNGVAFNPVVTGSLTPTHQFTSAVPYTVALRVTDSNGLSSISTLNLTVNNVAPTVNAGATQTVNAGDSVAFAGSFTDPGGASDTATYAWDFNYNGTTFNPGAASTLTPSHIFTTPGTYTVALSVTDSSGDSGRGTLTVTVNPVSSLVVNAGPDQTIQEGATASFSGSYTDASGTVNPGTADWDFNYNGSTFNPDATAHATLTPSHLFGQPATYLIGLRLTDSNSVTRTGTLYVTVANVAPTINAGADQTVNQGTTVTFSGTASDPGGPSDLSSIGWDFNYNGVSFNPDSSANGTLTPTHLFATPGDYRVALQVVDQSGAVSLSTLYVFVNDVAPTATVTNSGTTPEGSPVTFTVANLMDLTPNDTPSYWAEWTGGSQFVQIRSDQLTTNSNGSVSFTHVYDDNGTYPAVIRVMDGGGNYTDYAFSVAVTDVAPTATFGQSGGNANISATVPFIFFNPTSPSHEDMLAGFAYNFRVDGGAYSSNTSGTFFLPSSLPLGSHTVQGYLVNKDGGTSPVYAVTVTLQAPQVALINTGTGQVQLSWSGGGGPVVVSPNQLFLIPGTADGLTVTLLNSGANYQIFTSGSIAVVNAAAGVQNFTLVVDTTNPNHDNGFGGGEVAGQSLLRPPPPPLGPSVGDGHVGEIDLPANTTLSVYARGNLGNIFGLGGPPSQTTVQAVDLYFANLTGSVAGLDHVVNLVASGWLGLGQSQLVTVNDGIDNLSAYGIGAKVIADANYFAADPFSSVTVGDGGIPGILSMGNVSGVQSRGGINQFFAKYLSGSFSLLVPDGINQLAIAASSASALVDAGPGSVGLIDTTRDFRGDLTRAYLLDNVVFLQAPAEPSPADQFLTALRKLVTDNSPAGDINSQRIDKLIQQTGNKEITGDQAAALAVAKAYNDEVREVSSIIGISPLTINLDGLHWYENVLKNPLKNPKLTSLANFLGGQFTYYKERLKETDKTVIFKNGKPDLAFMHQGATGDCAFMAAVSSLVSINNGAESDKSSALVKDMITSIPGGKYKVTFAGFTETVSAPTETEIALYANAGANGLWLTILEKAYSKHRNDDVPFFLTKNVPQDKLQTGEVLRSSIIALTGHETTTYTKLDVDAFSKFVALYKGVAKDNKGLKAKQTANNIRDALVAAFNAGAVITLSVAKTQTIDGQKLQGGHAYAIVNIDMSNPNNPKFTVRNPWNNPNSGKYGADFVVDMDFLYEHFTMFTIENKN